METETNNVTTLTKFVGSPDGPMLFIPGLGLEVKTFTDEQEPKSKAGKTISCLRWHVPLKKRGEFRPEDLANYNPKKNYRTDPQGFMLCYGVVKSGARQCRNRATNRFSRCESHGGRLHPLDKIAEERYRTTSFNEDDKTKDKAGQQLSRYKQFLAGTLTVEDLDDEELATCSFRKSNGGLYRPLNVPREMAHAFTRAIFDRAQAEMRSHTVTAAKTMAEIMVDKTNDPEVRLKAAKELLERNLGRTPQVLAITAQAPWEEIFDGIATGTRESSRQQRKAIDATGPGIIDAEVVDGRDSVEADAKGDNRFENPIGEDQHKRDTANSGENSRLGKDAENSDESLRDSRHFARNPAILAQTLEIPPDTGDTTENIDVTADFDKLPEPDQALKRQYIRLSNGDRRIRHILHIYDKEFQLGTEFIKEPEDNKDN